MSKTLLLQSWDTHKLLNNKPCQEIDKINVNEYDYVVGPYLINGNHWTAFIIDIPKLLFLSLDPKKFKSDHLDVHFENWLNYYKSRYESSSHWAKRIIDHPLQTDGYNCGVYGMLFIKNYV